MIEKDIEARVIGIMGEALSGAGVEGVQIVGAWQTANDGRIKALEGESVGILTVRANPRQYETPTIPDATIEVELSLVVRSDVDATGSDYLAIAEVVADVLQRWQASYVNYHDDFVVEGFEPTGFRQLGGDVGVDAQNCIFSYSQGFTLNGIIN